MLRRALLAPAALAALLAVAPARARQPGEAAVTAPVVVEHVDPDYPASARPVRHADVVLTVTVDAEGKVAGVEVFASGGAEFDEIAVEAMRKWSFVPATRDGRPISSRIRVPMHFTPPGAPTAGAATGAAAAGGATVGAAAHEHSGQGEPHEHGELGGLGAGGAPEGTAAAEPPPPSEDVTVVGRSTPASRGASDFNLKVGELARVPRKDAAELMKLAPGILLTNEGGEGHPHQVFLRGFDAREGQDVEFSAAGVPVNEAGNLHGNGFADTHFVIPELVTQLRVLEGPFDPRQGNFAVAGSAEYELGLARRGLTAKYTRGSFATDRLLLLWGPAATSASTFGGAELYRTDGFGQNRAARRASAMAQYEGKVGERGTFRLFGQGYGADYKSAGLLRADDVEAGRKGFYDTYDPVQGGQSTRFSVAASVESRAGRTTLHQDLFLVLRGMRTTENFTGYLLDVRRPTQQPHPQRGDAIDRAVGATTLGGRGFARTRAALFGQTHEVELGYFARYDATDATQLRLQGADRVPYQRDVDLGARLGDLGLWADANLRLAEWLAVRGGVRADLFTFDVLNRCASKAVRRPSASDPPGDASCLSQQDFGRYREPEQRETTANAAVLPRATVLVGPFRGVTVSASYGQGVRSIDPLYVYQDVRVPFAQVDAAEGGASWAMRAWGGELTARSVLFRTHVDRDLVFNETEGRNTLANGTTRLGWVGAARFTGAWLDQAANVTLVRSTFDDTHLLVPYVPDLVVRSDTAAFADLPWAIAGEKLRGALSSGVTFVGRRALPYGQRSDVIFTVDASASLAWSAFELALEATNLFDVRYRLGEYNFASDWRTEAQPTLVPVRHFAAGAPRALFVSLSATLEGKP